MTSPRASTHSETEEPARPATPLRVLLLEDSAADADLILHELTQGGYEPAFRRVESHAEMMKAIAEESWEIALVDYSVGSETALETLALLGELNLDLPLILISGVIGEEEAADVLRAGARDFVNKGNLTRLVPAIARELEQVENRRQQGLGEEALRQSEQRLRLALRAGGMGSWEWNLVSGVLHWSETLESMFGLAPGAFGGTYDDFIALVHPDDRELVGVSVDEAVSRDTPAVVYRAQWPDGTVHWHERKSQRIFNSDGRPQAMAGVTFDVTEREEAAQALRESEERFRLIAEHAHDLIALLDADGCYRYLSPSCESILGYPAGALVGTAASELMHPDDLLKGSRWEAGLLTEARMKRIDGSWLWVEGLTYEIAGSTDGAQFAVIARDISERKNTEVATRQLEDELRQSQKMEAVGQLAGGIAHDFNNLLTVISGYTEILLRRLGREAEGSKEISEISKAAARAARLTRQLLAYSRKQMLDLQPLDLNEVVVETQTMLEKVIGEDIEFTAKLSPELMTISADHSQIEQIIINLIVNARDAMRGGGKLVLETSNLTFDDGARAAGDYVMLAVTDTGEGMSAATADRIFEPFYTTKARGAGTGLGLSTVYGIVKQSGGDIEVESEPGRGTTFRIYFPCAAGAMEAFRPKPPDDRSLRGLETVLLVEDEEALRGLGKEMLEPYGYTVLLAADGAEALELVRHLDIPIELLITDILMPKIGGIELAARLSKLRPEMKVLYTSGYNDSGGSLERLNGARYLQKPYAMEELARTLRELLDEPVPILVT